MTHLIKKPQIAILGEFDGTLYHGNIWKRHTHQAEAVKMDGSVMHSDIIAFLNGYGTKSGQDLNTLITANKPTNLGDLTCGIDDSNKFFLKSNTATGWGLSSQAASREMFGYDGTETVQQYQDNAGAHYRLTANGRWQRGVFQVSSSQGGLKLETPGSNISTSFTFLNANAYLGQGDYTLLTPNNSYSNGASYSDFTVGTTISATSGGIARNYLIHALTQDAGLDSFVLKNTDGSVLPYFPDFQNHGHTANSTTFSATIAGSATVTDVVPDNRRVQNLITWIRVRGSENDADDIYNNRCLEDFEHSNIVDLTWVLEADGRVSMNFPGIYGGAYWPLSIGNITTAGMALLLRLGFAGEEPTESTNHPNHKQVRATHRAPCVLATGKGYVDLRREIQGRDDHSIMADGSIVSGGLVPIRGWAMTLRVKGPAHGHSSDQERHLREWWSYARRGLTIYPSFGDGDNADKGGNDTRRHIDKTKLAFQTAFINSGAHNLSQTCEADESANHHGKRVGGRLLVRRHTSDQQARRENYSGQLDLHQDIRLRVIDDPSR